MTNPTSTRLPIVGVMGSGHDACPQRSQDLGIFLGRLGVHLLTGGGGGVMAAVSRAFIGVEPRKGLVIGILPGDPSDGHAPPGYPNPWVELPIRTHLPLSGQRGKEPLSRNHINVLSSDLVIALPGGSGTLSEVELALQYGKPTLAFLHAPEELPGLPDAVPIFHCIEDLETALRQKQVLRRPGAS